MKLLRSILSVSAILTAVPALAADDDTVLYEARNARNTIWMDVGIGYMNAKSHELVYDEESGRKVSELIWEVNDAAVAEVNLGFQLTDDMALKLRGTIGLDADNYMKDYDWLDDDNPGTWTDLSKHEDTRLDNYLRIDAALQWDFADLDPLTVGALVGVRATTIKWSAYGGDYIYSEAGLRDSVGSFPDDELGITYEQFFGTPYLGLTATVHGGDFSLTGTAIASVVAKGTGIDQHWLRGVEFEDNLSLSTMFSLQGEAVYRFNDSYQVFTHVEYEHYADTKGSTDVKDLAGNLVGVFGDGASGADHSSLTAVAGVRFAY